MADADDKPRLCLAGSTLRGPSVMLGGDLIDERALAGLRVCEGRELACQSVGYGTSTVSQPGTAISITWDVAPLKVPGESLAPKRPRSGPRRAPDATLGPAPTTLTEAPPQHPGHSLFFAHLLGWGNDAPTQLRGANAAPRGAKTRRPPVAVKRVATARASAGAWHTETVGAQAVRDRTAAHMLDGRGPVERGAVGRIRPPTPRCAP